MTTINLRKVPAGTPPTPPPRRWYADFTMDVPEGSEGDYQIIRKTVDAKKAEWNRMMAKGSIRHTPEGTWTILMHRDPETGIRDTVMSDVPIERLDHRVMVENAKGNVLINGLGIGMCIEMLHDRVDHLYIIEKSSEVIKLVGPHYEKKYPGLLRIIQADALEFVPKDLGIHFDCVWHDLWNHISSENLPDMIKLHRKWGRWTDWQGSWCRKQCEILRDRDTNRY